MKQKIFFIIILILTLITFISATEFDKPNVYDAYGRPEYYINLGDKIILENNFIEIKEINKENVIISVNGRDISLELFKKVALTPSIDAELSLIDINKGVTRLHLSEKRIFNGDGTYKVTNNDLVVAENGYRIKIIRVVSTYATWWNELELQDSNGRKIYEFKVSKDYRTEKPVYNSLNGSDIVLYLTSDQSTITVRSLKVEENEIEDNLVEENNSKTNECKDIGLRNNGEYCSIDKIWDKQKTTQELCENNFECESNICVSGECIDSGLLQRILIWFKRLFGMR